MSADGSTAVSTARQPIAVSDGFHCSDMLTKAGTVDSTVLAVQQAGLAKLEQWVKEFIPASKKRAVERSYAYPVHRA